MPKQTYTISAFHGGISSDADPRDIKESEYPALVDANIDSVGRVKTLGSVSVDASDTNTLQIYPNRGLFSMGSDKQLDGGSGNETFLIAYDDGQSGFDIRDSEGWDTNQITAGTFDSDLPVFYVADGNLRIVDGDFDDAVSSKWFGYIKYMTFDGLNADSGYAGYDSTSIGWVPENQEIATPTVGKCLISAPHTGSDTNGVNSSASEYIGNVVDVSGEDVAQIASVNLRVGMQYTELHDNAAAGWAGTNVSLSNDDTTYYPLIADNNVKATTSGSATTSSILEDSQSYSIDDEENIVFGFYITTAEHADMTNVIITNFTSGDAANINFMFTKEEIVPDCWNLLVCSATNIRTSASYVLGDTLVKWNFVVKDTGTASPTFYVSGPVSTSAVQFGFQPGQYQFYYSWLYDEEKQESLPYVFGDVGSGNVNKINVIGAPVLFNFDTYVNPYNSGGSTYTISKRITGSRLYYKVQENDNYYLIGELDFIDKGFKWFPDGDTMAYSMANTTNTSGNFLNKACVIKGITPTASNEIDTFRTINGFSGNVESISAKFKTATVQGRRVYGGNVRQNSKDYPDRLLKSQVNKFDVFPDEMGAVDVVINDGESIVALEAFADRILQFKEKTMYIINVSENMDFLEDTHENKGCAFSYHVTKTDFGVAWFNSFGVYFFDGKSVNNILEKNGMRLISESDWEAFITDGEDGSADDATMENAHIAYIPKKRQLLIKNENTDVHIYDFVSGAWMKGASKITISTNMTNFVLDGNQDLIYLSNTDADVMTWNPDSATSTGFVLQTRDIDFGEPSIRKKIYKVYVTYKCASDTNVDVKFDVNGGTSHSYTFATGNNYAESNLQGTASAWAQATLKPSTSSQANNVYSFSLKFTTSGTVPASFEINDISVVYRMKGVK